MELSEAIEILEQHNKWRVSHEIFECFPFDTITEAIDTICLEARNIKSKKSKQPSDDIAKKLTLFGTWWNKYNKKTGRELTQKKWINLTFEEIQTCLNVVDKYVESKPDKQFRKDPATYLNQKCWDDEIILPNNKVNGKSISEVGEDVYTRIMSKYSESNDNDTNGATTHECDYEVVD